MATFEDIPLDNVELKPSSSPVKDEPLPDSVITDGKRKRQKTIMTKIFSQTKKVVSQQPSYLKLEENESESDDPIAEVVSFLKYSRMYIVLTLINSFR